jgi:hypothetical protein
MEIAEGLIAGGRGGVGPLLSGRSSVEFVAIEPHRKL